MAKESNRPTFPQERDKALEMALGQIEKQFGKGSVMKMGEKGSMKIETIPTGALALDLLPCTAAKKPEEQDHDDPRQRERDRQKPRVCEALGREQHDEDPEAERVERVQPPQHPAVLAQQRTRT